MPIRTSGTALLVLSGISGACINVFTKLAFRAGLNVPTFLAFRALAACLGLWSLLLVTQGRVRLPRYWWWRLLALGALGYATQSLIYNEAIHRLPAGIAVLGLYTYPALVVILSLLLGRERMAWIKLLALCLSLMGVALVLSVPTHGVNLEGAIFALSSAALWAVVILAVEKPARLVPPLPYAAIVLTGMAISFDAFGLGSRQLDIAVAPSAWVWMFLSSAALVTGVAATAGAIARMGPVSVAIGSTIEPLATVLFATVLLSERLSGLQLVGGGLVVAALGLIHLSSKRRRLPTSTVAGAPTAPAQAGRSHPPAGTPEPHLNWTRGNDA